MANNVSTYTPKFGAEYKNNQIVLASDRIMLRSKTDSIFLFGEQSVSLSSIKTINLDATSGVIIQSPTVRLGSHTATERVILGDKHLSFLIKFLDNLNTISTQLQIVSAGKYPSNPEIADSMSEIAAFGRSLSTLCIDLKNELPLSLSNTTKTV